MDPEEIKTIVQTIQSSHHKNKEAYFAEEYKEFKEKYPVLYSRACSGKTENLDFMLNMLKQINNNQKSQFDASAAVGQMLYDKYVDPKIKKH